jgi:hypothetical protein
MRLATNALLPPAGFVPVPSSKDRKYGLVGESLADGEVCMPNRDITSAGHGEMFPGGLGSVVHHTLRT